MNPMAKLVAILMVLAAGPLLVPRPVQAQGSREMAAVEAAAEAMGGRARLQAVKSLKVYGYGMMAYQDGGGNISSSPRAPQKYININRQRRTIDYVAGRMHVEQVNAQNFVMSDRNLMTGAARPNFGLERDISWNNTAAGPQRVSARIARARRIDMLAVPLTLVRTALDRSSRLSNLRTEAGEQLIDMVTAQGDEVTFALSGDTHLPAWMRWTAPHPNFGDVVFTIYYTGYQREFGWAKLPSGYSTRSDFRDVNQNLIYVDKYEVDVATPDLAPPAGVLAQAVPADLPPVKAEVIPVAKGVWYIKAAGNSTLWEFADHLVLFEAYGSEPSALATIEAARRTVPGKPLTHVVVSHHHIDHTGGLRAAVAEGLTVITNRNNEAYVREVTSRPAAKFPDALQRSGRVGKARIEVVDDRLTLRDGANHVELYKVVQNNHYADGLIAYTPAVKAVSEGDLSDEGWNVVWLGPSYPETVKYWEIDVAQDLPVHGNMSSYPSVIAGLKKQAKGAEALCAEAEAAHLNVQGCPLVMTMDRY